MDSTSLAHPTRTIFVDQSLLEEIAELTGIEYRALSRTFAGEEKDLALGVVKTAVAENPKGPPEEWQDHVLAWAKENGSGEYRPGYWARGVLQKPTRLRAGVSLRGASARLLFSTSGLAPAS